MTKKFFFTHPALLTIARVLIGGIFLLFGISKATAPAGEFFLSIDYYQLLPATIIPLFGYALIYIEIIIGAFFTLGIFTRWASLGVMGLLLVFMIAIGQAVLRGIVLPDCGCSGGLINIGETPAVVFSRDLLMLCIVVWMFVRNSWGWTVDRVLEK